MQYDIDLSAFQPREAFRKHVAALRACGVPRTQAKRAARDLIDGARAIERAVGKRSLSYTCIERAGGWTIEIFVPREGLSATQCELVQALGDSSAAKLLGRLQ